MSTLNQNRRIPGLLAGCTLFAGYLLSSSYAEGVALFGGGQPPRYPAIVVTTKDTTQLPLSLDIADKSDSPLFEDISSIVKNGKRWRVSVFRFSNGKLLDSTDWKSVSNDRKVTLKNLLPEVLLRADVEVCNNDDPDICSSRVQNPKDPNDPKTKAAADAVHEGRTVLFLLHKYPD